MHPIPISVVVTGIDASVANSRSSGDAFDEIMPPTGIDERALGMTKQFEGFLYLAFMPLIRRVVATERDLYR